MRPTPRHRLSPLAILVIAALLLLGTAAGKLRIDRCVGECAVTATATSCCAAPEEGASGGCCGCCCEATSSHAKNTPAQHTPTKHASTAMVHEHRRTGGEVADEAERLPCCVTVAFGEVQFGPIDVELPNVPPVLYPPPVTPTIARPLAFDDRALTLPFERGPPRIDARTALRASTVLLI